MQFPSVQAYSTNPLNKQHGSVMLQWVLILPVFFIAVLGAFDIVRIMAINARLSTSAEAALAYAKTAEHFGFRETDGTNSAAALATVREKIIDIATNNAKMILLQDCATSGNAQLLCGRIINRLGIPLSPHRGAIVLRPGDTAEFVALDKGSVERVLHPTLESLNPRVDMYEAMHTHPLVVEMRAHVERYLPFLPPVILSARAVGFREYYPPRETAPGDVATAPPPPIAPSATSTTTTTLPPSPPPSTCARDWSECIHYGKCPSDIANPRTGKCLCGPCPAPIF